MGKANEVAELESHLGFWLRFVSNHVSHSFRDRLAKHDVTVAEWVVLRTLFTKAPCTLRDLSQEIGVDAGALSRLVDKLLARKLVSRKASPTDRRAVTLELAAGGKGLIPKLVKEADENDAAFFGQLSAADRAHLQRIFKSLIEMHNLKEKPTN